MKAWRSINIILLSMITIWGVAAYWGPLKESNAGTSTGFSASTNAVKAYKTNESMDEISFTPTPDELIRFHVLANSDSERDQELKHAVRDAILKEVSPRLAVSQSLDESRDILKQLSTEMEDIGRTVARDWGKNYSVRTEYGRFSFPTKSYGSLVLPAGQYEALRVVIGEGKGSNWWCVLFPPLCFIDIKSSTAVPVDGKAGIPHKIEVSVNSKEQTNKNHLITAKPKVRFYFWELINRI
ncbi:stage II sporulation protein R [Desulfosporosinus sp. BICA1-9]|uniref:stage II sporulation protein R n=1 Tax=Desulfosporosinus sp. BICA1-9 TaxID=1531958 RepID=UPI00054B16E6|nr:stage II sporulation protein R [Desulfosporosinus sp. BICA1-9]KJS48285.1 MAG: stage II sporulation protein R [Peptococcaceae bacterium BRH_c23]KJS89637.1 MAG: stage II sporulation protein R [Desulfosporosinus sp. BICA1-9]